MANRMRNYQTNNIQNTTDKEIVVTVTENKLELDSVRYGGKSGSDLKSEGTLVLKSEIHCDAEMKNTPVNSRTFYIQPGETVSIDRPNTKEYMSVRDSDGKDYCNKFELHSNEVIKVQDSKLTIEKGVSGKSFNTLNESLDHARQQREDDRQNGSCCIQ